MTAYRVLVGINYQPHGKGEEVRAEVGDQVDDVPAKAAKVWLAEGVLGELDVDHVEGVGPDGNPILVAPEPETTDDESDN